MIRKIAILLIFLLLSNAVLAATMYRWTDDDGTVHYTENPPSGADATPVHVAGNTPMMSNATVQERPEEPESVAIGSERELSPAEQRRQERAQRQEEARAREAEFSVGCANARYNLAQLEPRPKVLIEDGSGGTRVLDDQERLDMIEEARTYIEENCDDF